MSHRIQTMLPRQLYCGLPQPFGDFRPVRLCAPELIQLPLQLDDRLGDGQGVLIVQYQPTSADD
jgi:hypothetical protein